jgi:hypothetical protein
MDDTNSQNKLMIFRYFLTIFFIVSAVVMGAVTGFYYNEKGDYLSRLKLEERVNIKLEKALIENSLIEIISDLGILSPPYPHTPFRFSFFRGNSSLCERFSGGRNS